MNRLLDIGFQQAGQWRLENASLVFNLEEQFSKTEHLLYAFICNEEIKYIGKTTRTLKSRMELYKGAHSSQPTNVKNNRYIKEELEKGNEIKIYILPDNGLLKHGNFHISLVAGLEDNLIEQIKPAWNGKRLNA